MTLFLINSIFLLLVFLYGHLKFISKYGGVITAGYLVGYNLYRGLTISILAFIITYSFSSSLSLTFAFCVHHISNNNFQSKNLLLVVINIIPLAIVFLLLIFISARGLMLFLFPISFVKHNFKTKIVSCKEYQIIRDNFIKSQQSGNDVFSLDYYFYPDEIYISDSLLIPYMGIFGNKVNKVRLLINDNFRNEIVHKQNNSIKNKFIILHEISHVVNGDLTLSLNLDLLSIRYQNKYIFLIFFIPYLLMYIFYQVCLFFYYASEPILWKFGQMLNSAIGFVYLIFFIVVLIGFKSILKRMFTKIKKQTDIYADIRAAMFFKKDEIPIDILKKREKTETYKKYFE